MNVKDLIIELQKLDQTKEVYLSRDEEGNGYGTISESSINQTTKAVILYPWEEYVDEGLIFGEDE